MTPVSFREQIEISSRSIKTLYSSFNVVVQAIVSYVKNKYLEDLKQTDAAEGLKSTLKEFKQKERFATKTIKWLTEYQKYVTKRYDEITAYFTEIESQNIVKESYFADYNQLLSKIIRGDDKTDEKTGDNLSSSANTFTQYQTPNKEKDILAISRTANQIIAQNNKMRKVVVKLNTLIALFSAFNDNLSNGVISFPITQQDQAPKIVILEQLIEEIRNTFDSSADQLTILKQKALLKLVDDERKYLSARVDDLKEINIKTFKTEIQGNEYLQKLDLRKLASQKSDSTDFSSTTFSPVIDDTQVSERKVRKRKAFLELVDERSKRKIKDLFPVQPMEVDFSTNTPDEDGDSESFPNDSNDGESIRFITKTLSGVASHLKLIERVSDGELSRTRRQNALLRDIKMYLLEQYYNLSPEQTTRPFVSEDINVFMWNLFPDTYNDVQHSEFLYSKTLKYIKKIPNKNFVSIIFNQRRNIWMCTTYSASINSFVLYDPYRKKLPALNANAKLHKLDSVNLEFEITQNNVDFLLYVADKKEADFYLGYNQQSDTQTDSGPIACAFALNYFLKLRIEDTFCNPYLLRYFVRGLRNYTQNESDFPGNSLDWLHAVSLAQNHYHIKHSALPNNNLEILSDETALEILNFTFKKFGNFISKMSVRTNINVITSFNDFSFFTSNLDYAGEFYYLVPVSYIDGTTKALWGVYSNIITVEKSSGKTRISVKKTTNEFTKGKSVYFIINFSLNAIPIVQVVNQTDDGSSNVKRINHLPYSTPSDLFDSINDNGTRANTISIISLVGIAIQMWKLFQSNDIIFPENENDMIKLFVYLRTRLSDLSVQNSLNSSLVTLPFLDV